MRNLLLILALLSPSQVEPGWKAGLAEVKITPEEPVHLSGYASRNKPFTRVAQDLFAKALALEDAEGKRAVLITSDLIGFRASVAEGIAVKMAEKTGLKREQFLLNSSHTHCGPALSLDPSARENMTAEDAKRTVAYTESLQKKIADLAAAALAKLEPAKLSWGKGVATFPMNRREPTPRGVILGFNPSGPVDRSVPILRVDSPDGKLRAALFGCACHGTTLGGDFYEVNGDYGGFAQAFVQEQHPGAQAMLMLGCAGDANPHPRGTLDLAKEHGLTLGKEVCRVLGGKLQPVRGPLKTFFDRVDLPLEKPLPREELEKAAKSGPGYRQGVAKQQLAQLDKGEAIATHYAAPVALWQFGEDLTLVGLSGEVVVDYVYLLEKELGPLRLWVSAYCNDVFGYLPSARVIQEGGYETRGIYYGGAGFFAPSAQDAVAAKVRELAAKAGRK